jgi:hypothetical protein
MTSQEIAEFEFMRISLRMILNGSQEGFEAYQQVVAKHLAKEVELGRISEDLRDYLTKKQIGNEAI